MYSPNADDDDDDVFDDDGQVVSSEHENHASRIFLGLCPQIREHGLNLRTLIIAYIHICNLGIYAPPIGFGHHRREGTSRRIRIPPTRLILVPHRQALNPSRNGI